MSNPYGIFAAGMVVAIALVAGLAYLTRDRWLAGDGANAKREAKLQGTAGGASPVRTETTTFDNWTLTCRVPTDGSAPRSCYGDLKLIDKQRQTTLLSWIVGRSPKGTLASVFQTPTGVEIGGGVQFAFDGGKTRTLPYVLCEPQRCESSTEMDAAFLDEARQAVGSSRVDLQACKLEYSIVSPK